MNILLASDDRFVQHCCVTITSVLVHNPGTTVFLFTEGLSEKNVKFLNQVVGAYQGELHICIVSHDHVKDFPMPSFMSSHISIATYYRLFAVRLLPETVEKVIYLDCDMVIRDSLVPLWETDMTDKAIGAVFQQNEWAADNKSFERLGYSEEFGYFNAGMLLMNLAYWRENGVTERLFDYIRVNYDKIHSHDQDVLNAVLHQYVKPLSYTWNFLPIFLTKEKYSFPAIVDYSKPIDNPVIIHFVFKPKPWEYYCSHPYCNEYFKYLDLTPFKGWRPKNSWGQFKRDRLIPLITEAKIIIRKLFVRTSK